FLFGMVSWNISCPRFSRHPSHPFYFTHEISIPPLFSSRGHSFIPFTDLISGSTAESSKQWKRKSRKELKENVLRPSILGLLRRRILMRIKSFLLVYIPFPSNSIPEFWFFVSLEWLSRYVLVSLEFLSPYALYAVGLSFMLWGFLVSLVFWSPIHQNSSC